jgi:hypothetical protein
VKHETLKLAATEDSQLVNTLDALDIQFSVKRNNVRSTKELKGQGQFKIMWAILAAGQKRMEKNTKNFM